MSPVGAPFLRLRFAAFSELRPLPCTIHADLVLHNYRSAALLIKKGREATIRVSTIVLRSAPMAAVDQDCSAAVAPPLRRQLSYSSSRGGPEPIHDRKLSYSFSTPAATLSSPFPPRSSTSSFESIPVAELDRRSSSSSSTSSYESFYQFEDCFVLATTQPPAVQTMMTQGQPAGAEPKRLPPSMFRTRSTCPAQWSAASNESLFSIQLGPSGEVGDLYYDSAGDFHRMTSAMRDDWMVRPAASEAPSSRGASGDLCLNENCASCRGSGMKTKYAKFAATTNVCGESKHSPIFPTLASGLDQDEAPATEAKETDGWCMFRCCWPSAPSLWCVCHGCECRCGDCRRS